MDLLHEYPQEEGAAPGGLVGGSSGSMQSASIIASAWRARRQAIKQRDHVVAIR